MSVLDYTNLRNSLTTLPLEILRMVLDKIYEEQHTLTISKPLRCSTLSTTSTLPISPLLVNRHIYTESLDAIRRNKNNIISVKLHATFSDTTTIPATPSLSSFFFSVTTLELIDFPYTSSTLKNWKQTCPNLRHVDVQHAYSTAANASLHGILLTPDFPSLLRGDVDTHFATTAAERILHVHPKFHLEDLEGVRLTFPNIVDFWSPNWERKYHHENRVLVLSLTITREKAFVSQKFFKNRLRGIEYRPHTGGAELPRLPGVDYDVRFMKEGNGQSLDYDWRKDCFCSPYSSTGVLYSSLV